MQSIKVIVLAVLTLVSSNILQAQNTKGIELSVILRDGSIMRGTSGLSKVELKTDYGNLSIPIASVSRVTVGITPDESKRTEVEKLCVQISASTEAERRGAYEKLVEMPVGALPIVQDYMFSEAYTPAATDDYSLDKVINELIDKHEVGRDFSSEDVVEIDYVYTMGGVFSFTKLDLETEYGKLSIPKEKIEEIEVTFVPGQGGNRTFKLIGSKHITCNTEGGWLKTGIYLKKGQTFTIHASGQVTLSSFSGETYDPDGNYISEDDDKYYDDDYYEDDYYDETYLDYGCLAFKIGESGTPLKAGSNYTSTASSSGMLYLGIYETVYDPLNTGFFIVKVKSGE